MYKTHNYISFKLHKNKILNKQKKIYNLNYQ